VNRKSVLALGASAAALVAATTLAVGPAQAHDSESKEHKTVTLTAKLRQLNGSGASGTATAVVSGETIKHILVQARGLTPDAPHAQHIHYGQQALNECPTLKLDTNKDGRLTTVEGIPAYGPVVVSLNTSGDTTPASFLDVTRFPVSKDGRYNYSRNNINFTDVAGTGYPGNGGTGTAKQIAEAIRDGEGVLVIHGQDYDKNGTYNFSSPEGASELNPNLPAEATDPAVCGVLERH
jgi:Cu/Zn superoxide dismutase